MPDESQKTVSQLEDEAQYADDSAQSPPSDIVAYNELRSCADLFRMHQKGVLQINPDFQREVVWRGPDQTRFIDSLIKQLPIPSMCFALDHKAQKWIVIDGLQRISTIVRFLEGGDWRLSPLEDIDPEIANKTVAGMKLDDSPLHHFYTRVENLTVPITVLRCDFKKKTHMDYLFTIFHRLNTGGMKLNNQEIRNCIYGGNFNALLKTLDLNPSWRKLNKMKGKEAYRFTKQEVILRLFAFLDRSSAYEGQLAKFLNEYMHAHRDETSAFLERKREIFEKTVDIAWNKVFDKTAPSKLSLTVLEAVLIGVAKNLEVLESVSGLEVRRRYNNLLTHPEFSDASIREGLSKKPRVNARLNLAIQDFAGAHA